MSRTVPTTEIEAAAECALDAIGSALDEIDACERKLKRRGFSSEESRARLAGKAAALHSGCSGLTWTMMLRSEQFSRSLSHIEGEH